MRAPGGGYSEEDVALSGEYVLGLLSGAPRQTFESRLVTEAPLRQLVMEWDEAFAPLTDDIPVVDPPAMVWARIQSDLFGDKRRLGWLAPWIGGLAGALVAALVVLWAVFLDPAPTLAPTHTAEVTAEDDSLRVAVSVNATSGAMALTRIAGQAPEGRVLELWLIAEGADAPVSVGLLGDDATTELILADALRERLDGAVFAVSEEPPGGSPTGAPTGAILGTGPVSRVEEI